ncbi:hypothetical protein GCWU000342_01697 [Shuttleworthella satelles DSM 14600]|uniref:Uncharacterized protein n=1 Tax=Shuttleworthella satelles DSM 14600 TaxID=626523 RepID=C4GCK3_9FIRM|nr:hypothetical protein GCWU000342_01697 [Shuttleworthia satelles DSM 14600]
MFKQISNNNISCQENKKALQALSLHCLFPCPILNKSPSIACSRKFIRRSPIPF